MFFKRFSQRCREAFKRGNEKHDLKTSHLEHLRKILITFHFVLQSDAAIHTCTRLVCRRCCHRLSIFHVLSRFYDRQHTQIFVDDDNENGYNVNFFLCFMFCFILLFYHRIRGKKI